MPTTENFQVGAVRVTFTSHERELTAGVINQLGGRVKQCAVELQRDVMKSLAEGKARKTGRHSLPGQVPFIDTGQLRRSIVIGQMDKLQWFVGTNSFIGLLMELGGSRSVTIRPKRAKALKVPIDDDDILEIVQSEGVDGGRRLDARLRGSLWLFPLIVEGGQKFVLMNKVFRSPLKARPFLQPALRRNRDKILGILMAPLTVK